MGMIYDDFYDIAVYANENWKGGFSQKEIACNAHCYYADYELSKANGKMSTSIKTLCENLYEDLQNMNTDDADYADVYLWLYDIAKDLGYDIHERRLEPWQIN